MTTDGLDVGAVIDRFDASERTLSELRDRLRAIVLAEEGATTATEQLGQTSEALRSFASDLHRMTNELVEARTATIAALDAAREFLGSTDLGALRAEVTASAEENRSAVATLRSDMRALAEALPTVTSLRAENEKLKSVLSSKQRKQLGLT